MGQSPALCASQRIIEKTRTGLSLKPQTVVSTPRQSCSGSSFHLTSSKSHGRPLLSGAIHVVESALKPMGSKTSRGRLLLPIILSSYLTDFNLLCLTTFVTWTEAASQGRVRWMCIVKLRFGTMDVREAKALDIDALALKMGHERRKGHEAPLLL